MKPTEFFLICSYFLIFIISSTSSIIGDEDHSVTCRVFKLCPTQKTIIKRDINDNHLSEDTSLSNTCCIIPTCVTPDGQCYETHSCGYICTQGRYKPANYGRTPGYSIRTSYQKFMCVFGVCQDWHVSCFNCPHPQSRDFSIYSVKKDCFGCYYKS